MDTNPMQVLTQIAERNLAMWQAMSGLGQEEQKDRHSGGQTPSDDDGDQSRPGGGERGR
jgi:hypothetical protein